jgi:hypothetical protein
LTPPNTRWLLVPSSLNGREYICGSWGDLSAAFNVYTVVFDGFIKPDKQKPSLGGRFIM